jgi:hypothetical protein
MRMISMADEKLSMAELKNKAISLDRAEMWDLFGKKDDNNYFCKRHMLVMNIDKGEQACIAKKNYAVIQHKHASEAVIEAVTGLNLKAEAVLKTSRHGMQVDIDFPDSHFDLTEVGEKFTSGIRLLNDYGQQAGLIISPMITRLACSNGMIVVEIVKPRRIKFTEQLNIELEGVIDKIIKDIIASNDKLANVVSVCIKDSEEWNTLKLLLRYMFKQKKHIHEIMKRLPANKERITRWELYNSITDYATHGTRLKPEVDAWLHNKANDIMNKSFDKLCELEIPKVETEESN